MTIHKTCKNESQLRMFPDGSAYMADIDLHLHAH